MAQDEMTRRDSEQTKRETMAASSSKQEVERKRGGRRGEKKGNILRNRTSEFQRRIALARGARVVAPVSVIRRVMIRPVIPIHCIIPRYKQHL